VFEAVLSEVAAGGSSAPWLGPYRRPAREVQAGLAAGASTLTEALNAALDARPPIALDAGALRFVSHAALPPAEPYEAFIARTASVPTRDNLHDLFNALVWLAQPRLKTHLNRLHAAAIGRSGVAGQRGALRDALTVFDENGAVWRAPDSLVEALRRRDWPALFIGLRPTWQQASLTLVGHALLEKMMRPRKAITAHVWVVADEAAGIEPPEAAWLEMLTPERLAAKPFLPLPLLGVPGWWPANADPGFYDDAAVFRPLRPR
jgi:hypothetical protein